MTFHWHSLASIFDSLTHFVLLSGQAADKTQQMETTEDIELKPVKTEKQNSKIPISKNGISNPVTIKHTNPFLNNNQFYTNIQKSKTPIPAPRTSSLSQTSITITTQETIIEAEMHEKSKWGDLSYELDRVSL